MKAFSDMFDENLVDSQVQIKTKAANDQNGENIMIGDKREREILIRNNS